MSACQEPAAVVVGVDGSPSARHAVQWAAGEAALWHSPLRLVHVHVWPWVDKPRLEGRPVNLEQAMLRQAYDWLRDAADLAARTVPDVEIDTELVTGAAVPSLVAESRRARLLVLGSRGLGGVAGLLLGSTTVALAAHACCPVVVVGGSGEDAEPPAAGPVVLGVDGSAANEGAIAFGFEAAWARGVSLVAVHTTSAATYSVAFGALAVAPSQTSIEEDAQRLLDARLSWWQDKYPDVAVRRVVTMDRPVHSLLEAAVGAQLLVVGSRGRGGLRGMLLGSTSQALLRRAPCPVAVVHSAEREGACEEDDS